MIQPGDVVLVYQHRGLRRLERQQSSHVNDRRSLGADPLWRGRDRRTRACELQLPDRRWHARSLRGDDQRHLRRLLQSPGSLPTAAIQSAPPLREPPDRRCTATTLCAGAEDRPTRRPNRLARRSRLRPRRVYATLGGHHCALRADRARCAIAASAWAVTSCGARSARRPRTVTGSDAVTRRRRTATPSTQQCQLALPGDDVQRRDRRT